MCGFFLSVQSASSLEKQIHESHLNSCSVRINHRGPDFSQTVNQLINNDHIYMHHARLAIRDLSESGNQPFSPTQGKYLLYNGEIYNSANLASQYELDLDPNSCDTIVLAQLLNNCIASRFLNDLEGFWSFCFVDTFEKKIVFSRDRIGQKPFFYVLGRGSFFVASELKSLLPISRLLNVQVLELNPGCHGCFDYSDSTFWVDFYWKPPSISDTKLTSGLTSKNEFTSSYQRFKYLFEESVRLRLVSDRPVSVMLSGGIDSTAVAIAASKFSNNLTAFTSYFKSSRIDESSIASDVCNRLSISHVHVPCDNLPTVEEISSLFYFQEQPIASFSQLISARVFKHISLTDNRVVLSGQGADELFWGYRRYVSIFLRSKRFSISAFKLLLSSKRFSTLRDLLEFVYFTIFPYGRPSDFLSQFSPDLCCSREGESSKPSIFSSDVVHGFYKLSLGHSQLGRLARYDDRNSSAYGLEVRAPFFDSALIDFATSVDISQHFYLGYSKSFLRYYLIEHGFSDIGLTHSKLGFPSPHNAWMSQLKHHLGLHVETFVDLQEYFLQEFVSSNS
jgi:asparagine synthase (glutamine-hydrolysing)